MTDQKIEVTTKLSNKHKAFIDAYFRNNMNATEAYYEVYPKVKRVTATVNGAKLLTIANVKSEIDRRMKENAMSADEDLHRLSDMGRASLMPFVKITDGGTVYFDFSQPDAKKYLHLIKKIKTKRTRRVEDGEKWEDEFVEVELYDSQSALALIAKYHNLIVDRTDITSKGEKITPDDHGYDRSIHELADAIREIIPGASAEKNSIVDTPEQTSVAGPIIKG